MRSSPIPLGPSRRSHIASLLLVAAVALAGTLASATGAAAEPVTELRVGIAEIDITPPEKYPMSGYYHERLATGTIDPLKARAIVFQSDEAQAVLVCCDLTGIATDLVTEVRRRVAARVAVPPRNIVLTGSHSHTAPDYFKELYLYLAQPEGQRDSKTYSHQLIERLVEVIAQAHHNVRPMRIAAGSARQDAPVSFNRRFVMKDGSVRTWMSLDNPEVVRAAGPIDPELNLLTFRDRADDRPLGVLSNFALHLDTVGGTRWSADYPFFLEQATREALGPHVVSLFGTGCCGDINHVDPSRKERNKTDFIGQTLGATLRQALPHVKPVEAPKLTVGAAVVKIPLQEVTEEMLAAARPILTEARAGKSVDFFEQVRGYKNLMVDQLRHRRSVDDASRLLGWGLSHTWGGIGNELPLEVTTITLGNDVAIVLLPGEIFVDLGLAIKRGSPFPNTLVIELCNAVETVYIPTRAAYAGGSYEVTNSALEPGAGEALVEAALKQLRTAAAAVAPKKAGAP